MHTLLNLFSCQYIIAVFLCIDYHHLLIHSPIDGCLDLFHSVGIKKSVVFTLLLAKLFGIFKIIALG